MYINEAPFKKMIISNLVSRRGTLLLENPAGNLINKYSSEVVKGMFSMKSEPKFLLNDKQVDLRSSSDKEIADLNGKTLKIC